MKKYTIPILSGLITGLTVLALNISGSPEEIRQLFNQQSNEPAVGGAVLIQNYKPVTPSDGSVATSSRFVGDLEPDVDNSFNLGTSARSWRNIFASGTTRLGGNLLPNANNTYDIGAFGNAWRDIYASSSLRVGSGAASTTVSSSGNITLTGQVFAGAGTANNPAYTFGSDPNSGIYSNANDDLIITVGGNTNYLRLTTTQILPNAGGTEALPFIARAGDLNTGLYYSGDESLAITANGNRRFQISDSDNIATFYNDSLDPLAWVNTLGGLGASGTSYLAHTVPSINNAFDLGSPTSSWRNVYASGTLNQSWTYNVPSNSSRASATINKPCGTIEWLQPSVSDIYPSSTVNNSLVGKNTFVEFSLHATQTDPYNMPSTGTVFPVLRVATSTGRIVFFDPVNPSGEYDTGVIAWCIRNGN